MPRVPTYDNLTAAPSVLPNVAVRAPEMPGIAGRQAQEMGQGIQRTGGEFARIALDAQMQANQTRVADAMNQAVQAKLRLTYDPKEGYVHVKGNDALQRPDNQSLDNEWGAKLGTQLDDIEKGLGNDAQRRLFREQANQLARQFSGGVQQHVAKEYGDYQVSVQDGTAATAGAQMGLSWGDAAAVEQGRNAIKAATYEKGRLLGWSAQQTEANTVAALSPAHAAVIASAVDAGKLDYAREYLKQVNAELTPAARLQITKTLDAGDFETRTQSAADTLVAKHGTDTAAALKEARETYTGKDEDAIVARIQHLDAERVQLRERAQKDAADSAWKTYATTGTLSRIPPSIIAAMDGRDLEALRRTAKSDFEAAQNKREVKTDPNTYYALSRASSLPDFQGIDLRQYFDRLSPADRKHFIDLQTKANKPDDLNQVVSLDAQKSAMVKSLGLESEQAGIFYQVADRELNAAQIEKGRKLTQDERQAVLDRLVVQGQVRGGAWYLPDPSMRLFEAINSGRAGQFAPQFSDADTRKATAALQRRGVKNPTKDQIDAVIRGAYGINK